MRWASIGAEAVLGGVFVWAGVNKVVRPERWRGGLIGYWLPALARRLAFVAIPWLELAIVVCFATGAPQIGAAAAIGLMIVFSAAIVRARRMQYSNRLGCACFGGLRQYDYRLLLLRNAGITAAAAIVWWHQSGRHLTRVSSLAQLLVALGILGAAAGIWIVWQIAVHMREVADN